MVRSSWSRDSSKVLVAWEEWHLSSRQETKEVSLHAEGLSDFTTCVAEEREWQALGLGKLCIGLRSIRGDA